MTTNSWILDTSHSGVHFTVRHMVFSKVRGRFSRFSGAIELDDADVTRSRVAVDIEAASIDTDHAQRDEHLRAPDFFDAAAYPALRFRSTRVEKVSDEHLRVIGELTIRDVTREVPLAVEYGGRGKDPWGNERIGFVAKGAIDRKDFGLTWNQLLEAGGVLVGERIEIEIDVEAVKAAASAAA